FVRHQATGPAASGLVAAWPNGPLCPSRTSGRTVLGPPRAGSILRSASAGRLRPLVSLVRREPQDEQFLGHREPVRYSEALPRRGSGHWSPRSFENLRTNGSWATESRFDTPKRFRGA